MAHRKPLGTTCRTIADWKGATPHLLDALVTSAGTWYRIVGVEEKANPAKLGLLLERQDEPEHLAEGKVRWPDGEIGQGVHPFEWYPRDRKRRTA